MANSTQKPDMPFANHCTECKVSIPMGKYMCLTCFRKLPVPAQVALARRAKVEQQTRKEELKK